MPFDAKVLNVMIASPSDVPGERSLVAKLIHEWNAIHAADRRTVLLPVAWETHATPAMGKHPQEIINQELLATADILVAVFWTRLGSPTLEAQSGTVEEINGHILAGRPTLIYFSSTPIEPSSIDPDQYKKLIEFKKSLQPKGLYEEYADLTEFATKFSRNLSQTIIKSFPLAIWPAPVINIAPSTSASVVAGPVLKPLSRQILIAAAEDKNGRVLRLRTLGGLTVQTNGQSFAGTGNARDEALAEAAVKELCELKYLEARGTKEEVFAITETGYEMAEQLVAATPASSKLPTDLDK